MKPRFSNYKTAALTLVELLVIVFVVGLLVAILMNALEKAKRGGGQVSCTSVVKQICIDYLVWANDHNDKFPTEVSLANGGTMELTNSADAWKTFQVMSNELSNPKMLLCPLDTDHVLAKNFSTGFSAKNISYFIGLDASTNSPQVMLCGDDNFAIGGVPVKSGLLNLESTTPVTWAATRHQFTGNIGLVDGSIQILTSSSLTNLVHQTGLATNRLAIP